VSGGLLRPPLDRSVDRHPRHGNGGICTQAVRKAKWRLSTTLYCGAVARNPGV